MGARQLLLSQGYFVFSSRLFVWILSLFVLLQILLSKFQSQLGYVNITLSLILYNGEGLLSIYVSGLGPLSLNVLVNHCVLKGTGVQFNQQISGLDYGTVGNEAHNRRSSLDFVPQSNLLPRLNGAGLQYADGQRAPFDNKGSKVAR